jgi:hypothetical protein
VGCRDLRVLKKGGCEARFVIEPNVMLSTTSSGMVIVDASVSKVAKSGRNLEYLSIGAF